MLNTTRSFPKISANRGRCSSSTNTPTLSKLPAQRIGWYVTTSFFSRQSQEELAVDKYPLITVSGDRVVKELEQIAAESGVTVMELVRSIDDGYKERLKHRRPEKVLYI